MAKADGRIVHTVSVVIPVYRGAETLPALVEEIAALGNPVATPGGRLFAVSEVLLVWDCGPDSSDATIRTLAARFPQVRPVWLTRNFGQHAATFAGLASSTGEWVVTLDEDGQHNPASIGSMLDVAYDQSAILVYARPTNKPPHPGWRNAGSRFAKGAFMRVFVDGRMPPFHSYRLIGGVQARQTAAMVGHGVYLDVALQWVIARSVVCDVEMRLEGRPAANYRLGALLAHFWRLVVSVGARPLRIISGVGFALASVGVILAVVLVVQRLSGGTDVQGWTSTIVIQLISSGFIIVALGVIAEYIGHITVSAMGRPVYVIGNDPAEIFDESM